MRPGPGDRLAADVTAAHVRRSARVLVLDGTDRVLLLRFVDPAGDPGWAVPGGGVHEDESLPAAAARELFEEVGLVVDPARLGRPVASTGGYAALDWATGLFHDHFFVHRVDHHDVDVSGMEDLERSQHAGHRWWTVEELAATTEVVYPYELAGLVARLLAHGAPDEPVVLPWHH